ncbi:MAG: M50 family metallopeptidase [Solirubrobacteraceae bacterium]
MSWVLAFAGFAALIILHELGHFAAAKAVGMRVERFALFFPPMLFKVRRGETEYGVGAIPLGGYVRITGMNPNEEIPEEVAHRAYYRQSVWKRIVVIAAGSVMNVVVAFLILAGLYLIVGKLAERSDGTPVTTTAIENVEPGSPAAGKLEPGDRILAIDGKRGGSEALRKQIATHRCTGKVQRDGCPAAESARLVVERDGASRTETITPRYDAGARRPRIGFAFEPVYESVGVGEAASLSVAGMWRVTKATVDTVVRIFDPEKRKELSGVVGGYEVTRQSIEFDSAQAFTILAFISLSLAIMNLFPFLPLDGGHIFWALAEKVRGRAIPFSVMERAGVVGFVLVLAFAFIGLSNDIDRLSGEGFQVR